MRARKRVFRGMVFSLLCLASVVAHGQTGAADEMRSGTGGPGGNGPTIASQSVTMQVNTDNPSGNTFATPVVPITVTYSLGNQAYTGLPLADFPTGTGVAFAGTSTAASTTMQSVPIYQAMNGVGSPANGHFTSYNAAAGQGIDVAANGAINIFASARALFVQASQPSTSSRVRMADLTIAFSRPVDNPILHVTGTGGAYTQGNSLGFTVEFDLLTSGVTLTRLSGNPVFAVAAGQINNSAANPNASCAASQAGCGSVRINGTQLTSVALRIYLRGDGGMPNWAGNGTHTGDQFSIGVSLDPQSRLTLQKTTTTGVGTFSYTLTGTAPGSTAASLTTATAGAAVSTAPIIIPASFTAVSAAETIPAGWLATNVSCSPAAATTSITTTTATATIAAANMTPNSDITCAYTNRRLSADLSITKTNGASSVTSGGTTTYTIRVTNNTGSDPVTGAILSDPVAAHLTKTAIACSATPGQCTAGTTPTIAQLEGGYALPTLAAGQSYEITVACSVD